MTTNPAVRSNVLPLPLGEGRGQGALVGLVRVARGEGAPVAPRRAFTLVEMLVVVGLIAVLAALAVPAVMGARKAGRNAAIKTEIDMLHMAMMNYRNEYGSFPPCSSTTAAGQPMVKHLQRIFPRCADVPGHLTAVGAGAITPQNALASWLSGYTTDPTSPLAATGRRKLYDFDSTRLTSGTYFPSGLRNSPYVYIDSSQYLVSGTIPTFVVAGGTYSALRVPTSSSGAFNTVAQPAFNPDTFQILSAGADQRFGTDDDLSNFWPGTRRQYQDSRQ